MTDNEVQNDPSEDQPQEKTAKQLEKEAKKAAKLEKLKAKLDKKSATPAVQKDKPEFVVFGNMPLKRKRDPTFTASEKDALIQLVGQHFEVLESKKTDTVSMIRKNEEWKKVSHEFKAVSSIYPRDWIVLKNCWENLKKRAKQKQTLRNQHFLRTGGGPRNINEDPTVEKVLALIYNGVTGFHNSDDEDGVHALSSDSNNVLETTTPEVLFSLTDTSMSESDSQLQENVADDEPFATTSTSDWSPFNATIREPVHPILARSPSPSVPNTPLRGQAAPLAVVTASGLPASSSTNRWKPTIRQERESPLNTRRLDFLLKSNLRAEEKHDVEMLIKKEILKQEQLKTKQEQVRLEMLEIELNKLKE